MRTRWLWVLGLSGLTAVAAVAATQGKPPAGPATIYAAASLREVLPQIDGRQRFQFGGSNTLRIQIERGAPADLFAAASADEPAELHRRGRCDRPTTFATNSLAVIVPEGNPAGLTSVRDLVTGPRKRVSVGAPGVPAGDHARRLLQQLKLRDALTRNTVSNETNVGVVVSKVQSGDADAGFVYVTDRKIAGDRVRAIALPQSAQPPIRYDLCIVQRDGGGDDDDDARGAQAFIDKLRSERGRAVLRKAGFGLPDGPAQP